MTPLAVSVAEFAKAIGVSRAFGYTLVKRGEVRTVHLGRRVLVPVSEIERLVEGHVK